MKETKRNFRQTGSYYEQMAAEYLEKKGYQILHMNYRCRLGEIDIVARDGAYVVFCEVKYRTDRRAGSPLEAVDIRKQRIIYRCAVYYLTEYLQENLPCRFDVIGIEGKQITHVENAFSGW